MKTHQEQDQAWRQEHHCVAKKPEAIGAPGVQRPVRVADSTAKRTTVVVQRREYE